MKYVARASYGGTLYLFTNKEVFQEWQRSHPNWEQVEWINKVVVVEWGPRFIEQEISP